MACGLSPKVSLRKKVLLGGNLRPKRDVLIGFVDGNGLARSRRSPGRIARLKSRDGVVTSTPHGDRGAADGAHVRWRGAVTDRQTG